MTRQARTGILISTIVHTIAFILFAVIRLYYGEAEVKEELPVSFVNVRDTKLRRRAIPIRRVELVTRLSGKHTVNRPTARNHISSADVFYTDLPGDIFALAESPKGKGTGDSIISASPSVHKPEHPVHLRSAKRFKETRPLAVPMQLHIASGHDFLKSVEPVQVKASTNDVMQKFARTVRRRIESRRIYPLRARKSMIEGRVGVKLTISSSGILERAEIIKSSGHTILDAAALRSIRNAAPFPPFPEDIKRKRVQMTVYLLFKIR